MVDEAELIKRYNKLYLDIIMRYKEYIEENEHMHIADLPKLVVPDNERVAEVCKSITAKLPFYRYEENFPDAARLAFDYVTRDITSVTLPVQFWLTPEEVISNGAGDVFDKAVLLCSMLIKLGSTSSKVMIAVSGDEKRTVVVYSELDGGKLLAMDLEKGPIEFGGKNALLDSLPVKGDNEAVVYEFNDKMYSDLV